MRVTFSSAYGKLNHNISQAKEDIDRLNTMASSGSRILKQADDPLAWSQAIDFRQTIRQIDAYKRNIDFAVGWSQSTDNALNQMTNLVEQAKQQATQAISVPSSEKRQAQTQALDQIVQQAVNLANTQYGGRYLFSGQQFTTAPFTMTKDPISGEVQSISTYQGDTQDLDVRVGNGALQTVNLNGQEVFANAGTDVLQQLLNLKNAVRDGDTASIQQQETALDNSYQNLQRQSAIVGTRLDSLDERKSLLDSIKIQDQSQLSDLTGADIVEVITQLQQKQTVFQAALQVTSRLAQLNLTNFI
jgi:flagellar hook-associated protein 3 FlgL